MGGLSAFLRAGGAVEFVQNSGVDSLEQPLLRLRERVTLVHENPLITGAAVHTTAAHQVEERFILQSREGESKSGEEKNERIRNHKMKAVKINEKQSHVTLTVE